MNTKRPLPLVLLLSGALCVPFATIWSIGAVSAWAMKAKPTTTTVTGFSDYIVARPEDMPPALPPARDVWKDGNASASSPSFEDVLLTEAGVVLARQTRLYVLDPSTGEIVREISLPVSLHGVSAITECGDGCIATYSFESGALGRVPLDDKSEPELVAVLDRGLGQPILSGKRVVSNGSFSDEILRAYEIVPGTGGERASIVMRAGAPLFAGLDPAFGRQLNWTALAQRNNHQTLAIAFRWSDRIDIVDMSTFALERSLSGPVTTKLTFAVGDHSGERVFANDPETAHSYEDIVATPKAILALYSGRERRKAGAGFSLGAELHAFSWDGRPIGRWVLPEPVGRIAYDDATHILYALRGRPSAGLIAIDATSVGDAIKAGHQSERGPGRPNPIDANPAVAVPGGRSVQDRGRASR